MQRRRHLFSTAMCGDVYVTMQITSLARKFPAKMGRARCSVYTTNHTGPSPVDPGRAHLLSVGQAHITFEWAEHGRKRLQ